MCLVRCSHALLNMKYSGNSTSRREGNRPPHRHNTYFSRRILSLSDLFNKSNDILLKRCVRNAVVFSQFEIQTEVRYVCRWKNAMLHVRKTFRHSVVLYILCVRVSVYGEAGVCVCACVSLYRCRKPKWNVLPVSINNLYRRTFAI